MVEAVAAGPSNSASSSSSSAIQQLECPFCQYRVGLSDEYILLLHIESQHTEDSPFIPKDIDTNGGLAAGFNPLDYELSLSPGSGGGGGGEDDDENYYVMCPEDGCEELILLLELQNHMDFHSAEHFSMGDASAQHPQTQGQSRNGKSDRRRTHSASSSAGDRERERSSRKSHRSHHEDDKSSLSKRERKEGKVQFIEARPITPSSSGAKPSWLEKAAMAIVPYVGEPRSSPKREREPESKQLKANAYAEQRKQERRSRNGVKKLGKSDLGPYAHEKQMPDWLRSQLEKGGRAVTLRKIDPSTGRLMNIVQISNETPDLVPTIAQLSDRDPNVVRSWVCHPGVKHVGKQIPKEGGFCGYRNIQMVISYIQAAYPRGAHQFEGRIPTILRLQDIIEAGWDRGINASARMETGGIRGTRKYIGTSEAQTVFISTGIKSHARAFNKSEGLQTQLDLLKFVEEYFSARSPFETTPSSPSKVTRTSKAPIYFQHSGHSMTIVGIEKLNDGTSSLLVFDPFFAPSEPMKNLAGRKNLSSKLNPGMFLKVYRRSMMTYLHKYREFELIILDQVT